MSGGGPPTPESAGAAGGGSGADAAGGGAGFAWSFGALPPAREPAAEVALPGRDDPRPGARLGGRFEVVSTLGEGGMGVVLRARDLGAGGREVALKLLRDRLEPAQRARFQREGELTAALAHPGIVRVHSAGELDGRPFLAYELVEGGRSCEVALRSGPVRARLVLLRDVARALEHAHARGVVHRDLKPQNVLLDAAGRPRLADFGLAQAAGLERLTQTGAFLGTPLYMAPEQFSPARGPLGPWTDVWALGVMLHEALLGERPFEGGSLLELGVRVCEGRAGSLRAQDATISPDLEAVVLEALEPRPEERYPDAGALADDLDAILEARRPSASRGGARAALRRLLRRRRARLPWLLGAAAGIAAATVVAALALRPVAPADAELRAALAAAGDDGARGRDAMAALERRLARLEEDAPAAAAHATARAAAHLRLARARSDGAPAELARAAHGRAVEHARQAARLDPALALEAARVEARALLALGRAGEACDALERATPGGRRGGAPGAGADLAGLLELLAAQRAAGRAQGALSTADALVALAPRDPRAWREATRARLALGRADLAGGALEALAGERGGERAAWLEALRAEVDASLGRDPLPRLEAAARRWPGAPAVRAGLALQLALRGEVEEARELLARPVERDDDADPDALARLAALARALREDAGERAGPAGLPDAPGGLRLALARWHLSRARVDVTFARRAVVAAGRTGRVDGVVRGPSLASGLAPDARRGRARASVEAARAWLAAPAGLARDDVDAARARALEREALLLLALAAPPGSSTGPALDAATAARAAALPGSAGLRAAAREQARARLAGGEPAAALALLDDALPGQAWRADPEAARLRGEALLALGRPADAAVALEAGLDPERIEVDALLSWAAALEAAGQADAAAAARARVDLARGARRGDSEELTQRARHVEKRAPHEQRMAWFDEAIALDPASTRARFYRGQLLFKEGRTLEGLRELGRAVTLEPALFADEMVEQLRDLGTVGREVPQGGRLEQLLRDLELDASCAGAPAQDERPEVARARSLDRLLRGLLCAALVEFEVGVSARPELIGRATAELDRRLDDDPACVVAWTLRGFLHLRAGRLRRAERDLDVAIEAAPEAGAAAFYRALVRAARGEPRDAVVAELARARRGGYPPDALLDLRSYVELGSYLDDPRFTAALSALR